MISPRLQLPQAPGGGGGSGTPGGADTQVQFNDSGSFGGDTGLTYNKTTDTLTVGTGAGIVVSHSVKSDASDGLLVEANNGTDVGLLGTGNTANVSWYGSHNFSTATQDTLAAFTGAGKTLGSLATATYPSLTEVSYVKGVTSAIQTQLDSKASTAYVDNAVTGLLDFKGNTDASTNPNYPAASKGDAYVISVAGKIGGAAGTSVDVGDVYVASADNAGGTQAAVGSSWFVLEHNLVGALIASNNLSDVANASTARTNLGLAIGVDVQAYSADTAFRTDKLSAFAATTSAELATVISDETGSGSLVFATSPTLTTPTIGDARASSITVPSTGGGYVTYNTADEVTNYEKATLDWSSNVLKLLLTTGGTGTPRVFSVQSAATTDFFTLRNSAGTKLFNFENASVDATPTAKLELFRSGTSAGYILATAANALFFNSNVKMDFAYNGSTVMSFDSTKSTLFGSSLSAASGVETILRLNPTISQSGTAGYTNLYMNVTESSTGSGAKNLAAFYVGGVQKVLIDNTGAATFAGDVTVPAEVYGAGWNGSNEVPTKNDVYDKIETIVGVSDGDKGDITVSASGTTWTVDNDVVTYAKMQNISATSRIMGRITAGAGDMEELTGTQATTLLDNVVGDAGAGGTKGLVPAPAAGDAAAGKFLKADGTWTAPAGGGNVTKVGTPVDNQIGIWTGDGTIEGDANLTWDGTSFNIATAKNFQIAGATILADAAGTTTLSNIDALDATTEATIEAAIDTLANLTSVQGQTLTLAGAFITSGANSLTLTTTGATNVTLPTTGTLATLAGSETLSGKTLTAPKFADLGFIADENGNELIILDTVGSAVNEVTFANAATGGNPTFTASGGDANVGLDFVLKGTGTFNLKGNSTQAAELRLYEDTDNGTNYTAFKVGTQAGNVTYTLPTAAPAVDGYALTSTTAGVMSWSAASGGSGSSMTKSVNQTAHGLSAGDVVKCTGANTYAKAQADSAANAEVVGIVTTVADVDNFTLTVGGEITAGVPAVAAGTVLYLSPSSAGALTSTEPTSEGQVSKPLAIVVQNATRMFLFNMRGMVVATDTRRLTVEIPIGSPTSLTVTGDGQGTYYRIPSRINGWNLTTVAASVATAGTTGTLDIQIRNATQTADMLTTKITIDSTEKDSSTAATAAVIDTANDDVATGDQIYIDIDAVHTTPAKGLVVELTFSPA